MSATNPQKPDVVVDVENLLASLNRSFLNAARELELAQNSDGQAQSPVLYCMPKMQLTIQLSLTFSENKVKGILWSKTSTSSEQQVLSTIQVELVAVPRRV